MLADGEPAFVGLFIIFAVMVVLGICSSQGVFGPVY